jgi:uncharacterized membrane protein
MGLLFGVLACATLWGAGRVSAVYERRRAERLATAESDGASGRRGATSQPLEMHASVILLGIDSGRSEQMRRTLAGLAASSDTSSEDGRASLLAAAAAVLRGAASSWLHVCYRDLGWHDADRAEHVFDAASSDLRARFEDEVIRNADGNVTMQPAPSEPSAPGEEGPGVIVVSLIVVSRRELAGIEKPYGPAIRAALAERGALRATELVAVEVVWSPAAEGDRMSRAELEEHYPELEPIGAPPATPSV